LLSATAPLSLTHTSRNPGPMSLDSERAAFHRAIERWSAGDPEGTLAQFTEDVLYLINVDGLAVPFVASSLGKEDLRQRLQLVMATFHQVKFERESYVHEADHSRAIVNVENRHRITGERLCVRMRLRYWFRDGLIARVEEHLDAPYMEAFQRFVFHIENAARAG
jgi:ketosteroid isomerase-like protein